ncbi:YqkE family protein [Paenibacillus validus]|uniref:DUF3886 domain-containing protein n=1 Tax=Paenibacillus validus TaxID=44253 RepID=A0A7X2ZCZ0_9BACL|nr:MULTISPECIES: YqkE family protein [Paenibacillus]MED4599398.1 YqkE family protein [Paenibacillus validus]MED4605110.1 YqkE family protein [Paenibacillus validus]MUG72035.1 DUF3886 domain-containing protein [Paenibacillus validus]
MVKKKRPTSAAQPATSDKPATLKDLLNPDIVNKLKAQADDMKAEAAKREEAAKQKAAEARKAEEKRLENDFDHLLNNSGLDWRQYK